jgi:hypothetical protein
MLSNLFLSIRYWWLQLAYRFSQIAVWLLNQGAPLSWLSPPFQLVRDACQTIAGYFYSAYTVTVTIETILDDAWSKAKQVFDYAYDVLADWVADAWNLADNAWDKAVLAYNKARDALDYATGWLKDKAIEAYNYAVWAYNQIAPAVTAKAQEIYAWVKGIPAEIRTFVDGVVATIVPWVTGALADIHAWILSTFAGPINLINLWFDDIQNFFNDPWGWLVDKFTDWFLGPEEPEE